MGKIVAPRVAAAVWGLLWNRWTTARRFQGVAACVLCCTHGDDAIEHYVGCRVVRAAGWKALKLVGDYPERKRAMLSVSRYANNDEQAK
eukprot:1303721-Heterocapsa_arctica.AAC.1